MKKLIFSFRDFANAPTKDFGAGKTLFADSTVQSRTMHAGSLEICLKVYSIAVPLRSLTNSMDLLDTTRGDIQKLEWYE
jgi:hypothetical protein